MPNPLFEQSDTWDVWADKLLDWGSEQAKRRGDLADWITTNCAGGAK